MKRQSSDPALPLFDASAPSSASSTAAPTPSLETPTSTAATEGELTSSSASALENARALYRSVVSGSGLQQGLSRGSSPVPVRPSLSSWAPIPRYLVAELERTGMTREVAHGLVAAAWHNAGGSHV